MPSHHPRELVARLREGDSDARPELERLCREDLLRAAGRWGRQPLLDTIAETMLLWLEMFLTSRDPAEFARLSEEPAPAWTEFGHYVRIVVSRWLIWPMPADATVEANRGGDFHSRSYLTFAEGQLPTFSGTPFPTGYELAIYQKPKLDLSGDLVLVAPTGREFWLLMADGCGKGAMVHLLAQGFSLLWCRAVSAGPADPDSLLRDLQRQLLPHVPMGFFIEAVVARIDRSGRVTVASAGGGRVMRRERPGAAVDLVRLEGCLLGDIAYPQLSFGNYDLRLERGKELLLSTDGFYDQFDEAGKACGKLQSLLDACSAAPSLFDAAVREAAAQLLQADQKDDISISWLRAH